MTVAIFGTPGFVERAETFDLAERLRITGDNTGNLLFQHAVAGFVDGEKVFIGRAKANYNDPILQGGAPAMLFPAANMLRAGADWSGLNKFLERVKLPMVVFGLGVQGEHGEDTAGLVKALKANETVMRMVAIFRDKGAFIGVRGRLTAEICNALGLPGVEVTGCPSLMVSEEVALGQVIARRLAALREAGTAPRLVVTAGAAQELKGRKLEVERALMAMLREGDLYVQQSGGTATVALFAGDAVPDGDWHMAITLKALFPGAGPEAVREFMKRHGRAYFSVPEWMAATRDAGLFLGTRLHGNMIGVQQGIPSAMIAHDARTSELINQMKMPSLELGAFLADPTPAGVLKSIEFDAAAFDGERRRAAAIYAEKLPKLGVPVTAKIRALAAA